MHADNILAAPESSQVKSPLSECIRVVFDVAESRRRSVEGRMEDWMGGIMELRIAQWLFGADRRHTKLGRRHAHTHSEQQATGIERFELMGKVQGVDVFDMKPLEADRIGTLADPIEVLSYYPVRQVGCTGFPADSHDTLWIDVTAEKKHARCTECGSGRYRVIGIQAVELTFASLHPQVRAPRHPFARPPLENSPLERANPHRTTMNIIWQ